MSCRVGVRLSADEKKTLRDPTPAEIERFYAPLRAAPFKTYLPDEHRRWARYAGEEPTAMTDERYPFGLLRGGEVAVPRRRDGQPEDEYAEEMARFTTPKGVAPLSRPLAARKRSASARAADDSGNEGAAPPPAPAAPAALAAPASVLGAYAPLEEALRAGDKAAVKRELSALGEPPTPEVARRVFDAVLSSPGDRAALAQLVLARSGRGLVEAVRDALERGDVAGAEALVPPLGAPRGRVTRTQWRGIAHAALRAGRLDLAERAVSRAAHDEPLEALGLFRVGSPRGWVSFGDRPSDLADAVDRIPAAERRAAMFRLLESRYDAWNAKDDQALRIWGMYLRFTPSGIAALDRKLFRDAATPGRNRTGIKDHLRLIAERASEAGAATLGALLEECVAAGSVAGTAAALERGAEPDALLDPPAALEPSAAEAIRDLLLAKRSGEPISPEERLLRAVETNDATALRNVLSLPLASDPHRSNEVARTALERMAVSAVDVAPLLHGWKPAVVREAAKIAVDRGEYLRAAALALAAAPESPTVSAVRAALRGG